MAVLRSSADLKYQPVGFDCKPLQVAIAKLREARDLLAAANAPRATERVR